MMLSWGTPDEVGEFCMRVIKEVAQDGGYIMDAGAIMQNDVNVENMRVMTQVCREHGVYSSGSYEAPTDIPPCDLSASVESRKKIKGMGGRETPPVKPGVCFPWEQRVKDLPEITGDKAMIQKIWEDIDALGYMYIWQCLLSF
jgi:hypothetical protein